MRGEGESVSEAAAGMDKQYCRSSSEQRRTSGPVDLSVTKLKFKIPLESYV